MRTGVVVFLAPSFDFISGILEVEQPALIEAFLQGRQFAVAATGGCEDTLYRFERTVPMAAFEPRFASAQTRPPGRLRKRHVEHVQEHDVGHGA